MKRMVTVIFIIAVIVGISVFHIGKAVAFGDEVAENSDKIYSAYEDENWDLVRAEMKKLSELWERNRLWASMTLSTKQIDEIDISLSQCEEFAKMSAKEDFIGEFNMFCVMMEHITEQERVSLEELL